MLLATDWAAALNLIGFAFAMVFVLLVVLIFVLSIFGNFFESREKKSASRTARQQAIHLEAEATLEADADMHAAIAMALFSYFEEAHDTESNIITLEKISKRYTPWSSKIYGLNVFERRI